MLLTENNHIDYFAHSPNVQNHTQADDEMSVLVDMSGVPQNRGANMATRKFALVKDGKKRLEIVQPMFSGKRIIKIDGKEVGQIPNAKALKDGWELKGKGGANLSISKYQSWVNSNALDIRFNGKPIPKSDSNPELRLSYAYQVVYIVGALNLVLGILTALAPASGVGVNYTQFSRYIGIAAGIGYLACGYFIQRRSNIALGFALAGMLVDTILIVISVPAMAAGGGPTASGLVGGMVGGLFMRFFFFVILFNGFNAIHELSLADS